jgi:hypothetical protein
LKRHSEGVSGRGGERALSGTQYAIGSYTEYLHWARQKFLYEYAELLERLGFNTQAGGAIIYGAMRKGV